MGDDGDDELQRHPSRNDPVFLLPTRWHHLHHRHQNRRELRCFEEAVAEKTSFSYDATKKAL